MIREIFDEKTLLAYSDKTSTIAFVDFPLLTVCQVSQENAKSDGQYSSNSLLLTPKSKEQDNLEHRETVFLTLSNKLQSISVDQSFKYIFLVLKNGEIKVHKISTSELVKEFTHHQGCLNKEDKHSVFIDDLCTYVTYLGGERNDRLFFELINWNFTCKKLKKLSLKPEIIENSFDNVHLNKYDGPVSPLTPPAKDKKVTCNIF